MFEQAHLDSLFAVAREERDQSCTPFMDEDELLWNPILGATCTRHTHYCKVLEINWLTKLFIAQAFQLKDEDCSILLTKISEVKEEIGELKEALCNLGRKFGVCLFLIHVEAPRLNNATATSSDVVPTTLKNVV